jgi:hypothetical protein
MIVRFNQPSPEGGDRPGLSVCPDWTIPWAQVLDTPIRAQRVGYKQ